MSVVVASPRPPSPPTQNDIAQEIFEGGEVYSAFFKFFDYEFNQSFYSHQGSHGTIYRGVGDTVSFLKGSPRLTKREAIRRLIRHKRSGLSSQDAAEAIRLTIQLMVMVDCDPQKTWLPEERYCDFIYRCFPTSPEHSWRVRTSVRACKLQKRLRVEFRPTSDLAMHLLYDSEVPPCVYLFDKVGFLKAQLSKYDAIQMPLGMSVEECLERGSPLQLLCETIYSLQQLLFPQYDYKSKEILGKLIGEKDFDPECANYQGYRRLDGEDFRYVYWKERLRKLEEALANPPPRTRLERWLQSPSERNAFVLALLALFISIGVGLLSIALAAIQTWIAWMAWKYPVK
ncbi:unnamed protein product [Clonostachys rosea]|uniref:Uncharacterized protein n=1 Tax=Bionectria ochroleuca TaxID=29856 RepID=A0ABY6UUK5_BIOOC|nr:unnamed protein product [Clonostachys rosea]